MRNSPIIYVAADDSKDLVTFAVQAEDSPVCTQVQTVPNELRRLRLFLEGVGEAGTVRVCYEAGCGGFVLHRWVTVWGYQCDVVAPSLTPRRPGDRRKTDKRHARKLVGLYRAGELILIHVPTAAEEQVRDLVRCREVLQRECLRSRHYVIKLLTRYGEVFRHGRVWRSYYGFVPSEYSSGGTERGPTSCGMRAADIRLMHRRSGLTPAAAAAAVGRKTQGERVPLDASLSISAEDERTVSMRS